MHRSQIDHFNPGNELVLMNIFKPIGLPYFRVKSAGICYKLRNDRHSVVDAPIFFQPDNRLFAMRSSRLQLQIFYRTLFVKNIVPHGHLFCRIFKLSKISTIYL